MQQLKFILSVFLFFLLVTNCRSQNSQRNSSVVGVFLGSTPCSQGTRPVPGISGNSDCELIKWNLTLFRDQSKKTPTTYELHCVYGLPKQGTTGFIDGGKKIDIVGNWSIIEKTPSNSNAIIYRLNDDKTNKTISFLKLSDNLLHLLDNDGHLMIGSAAWSYTLSSIDNR